MQTNPLGTALSALRTAADMTLQEVADVAGVSLSYLSRAENGLVTPTAQWVQVVTIAIGERIASDARDAA